MMTTRSGQAREHLNARATTALTGLVQQRAMQLDVLAAFLGISRTRVYAIVAELRDAGMVNPAEEITVGAKWVVPTRRGNYRYFGRALSPSRPSRLYGPQWRAAAQARIALGATGPTDWCAERELSLRAQRRGPYPYDGRMVRTSHPYALQAGAGQADPVWAVKADVAQRTDFPQTVASLELAVAQAEADGCTAMLWLCTGAHQPELVRKAATRVRPRLPLSVTDLLDVTGQYPRIHAVQSVVDGVRR